jgi:hypothetical protein
VRRASAMRARLTCEVIPTAENIQTLTTDVTDGHGLIGLYP